MPGGDRTGPLGQGSRTGRGLGYCSGNAAPGFAAGYGGWGRGGGRWGGGGGFRNRRFWGVGRAYGGWAPAPYHPYAAGADPESEKRALQDEAAALRRQMDAIEQRLSAIAAGSKNE